MITCSSIKFSRHQMGYDLRRNESVTTDYEDMFATNMYAKVGSQMEHSETVLPAQEAASIIRGHDQTKPLFLYLAFMALHTPLVGLPPKKLRKKFSRWEEHSCLLYFHLALVSVRNAGRAEFEESSQEVRDMVLASVDQAVDRVISELRRAGMFRNSVVLLTTDNGGGPWYSNTPLRGTKETLFEGGIRAASFLLSPLLQVRSSH